MSAWLTSAMPAPGCCRASTCACPAIRSAASAIVSPPGHRVEPRASFHCRQSGWSSSASNSCPVQSPKSISSSAPDTSTGAPVHAAMASAVCRVRARGLVWIRSSRSRRRRAPTAAACRSPAGVKFTPQALPVRRRPRSACAACLMRKKVVFTVRRAPGKLVPRFNDAGRGSFPDRPAASTPEPLEAPSVARSAAAAPSRSDTSPRGCAWRSRPACPRLAEQDRAA